jgi:hypothetical protein
MYFPGGPRSTESARLSLAVVMQYAGGRRSFDTWDCAQIFVDSSNIVLTQVLEGGPRHDLQQVAIERRRKAVCSHGRGTRGWR